MRDNCDTLLERDVLACPACRGGVRKEGGSLKCAGCGASYPVKNGIPLFGSLSDYWCNVSRERMRTLNLEAREGGDWMAAARRHIPDYIPHLNPLSRADAQFIWPVTRSARVLDVGSMWGGLALPVARYCGEVVALDKTFETLEFLSIRASQTGVDNLAVVHSPAARLPFRDGSFDFVILNGVLEWVAMEEPWIYEEHWEGRWEPSKKYRKPPDEMQLDALREIFRVLGPRGALYIAIENRYGVQYFYGFPDDHNNVMFVPFLPRRLANLISKARGKGEYRTYIYSPGQLRRLAERAGFRRVEMYGTFPQYIEIKKAFPLEMAPLFSRETTLPQVKAVPLVLNHLLRNFVPATIAKHTTPSLLALCGKSGEKEDLTPRVLRLLREAGVIDRPEDYVVVMANNRDEDYLPTNVVLYDKGGRPVYFVKIARDPAHTGLRDEAENLRWLGAALSGREAAGLRLPRLVYSGEVEGVLMLVLTYLRGRPADFWAHYIMNKGFDKVGIAWGPFRRAAEYVEERVFLRRLNWKMTRAIDTLVAFQRLTARGETPASAHAAGVLARFRAERPDMARGAEGLLEGLAGALASMPEARVPLCTVHGDFDIVNILISAGGEAALVDFEHMEREGAAFFDLANLLFSPLILKWKSGYSSGLPFARYLEKTGGLCYIERWLRYYAKKSAIPVGVLSLMVRAAFIEQNLKKYPSYRDPYTYPMFGAEMLGELFGVPLPEG